MKSIIVDGCIIVVKHIYKVSKAETTVSIHHLNKKDTVIVFDDYIIAQRLGLMPKNLKFFEDQADYWFSKMSDRDHSRVFQRRKELINNLYNVLAELLSFEEGARLDIYDTF